MNPLVIVFCVADMLLARQASLRSSDLEAFLETGHELEASLDIAAVQNSLLEKHRIRWQDFNGKETCF